MDLKKNFWHLTQEQQRWVDATFKQMNMEQKIGQLFCISMSVEDEERLKDTIIKYRPGGFMFRPASAMEIEKASKVLRETTDIPLLLSANLECGGNGLFHEGTFFGRNIQIAATDDETQAFRQGYVCGAESRAFGVNWAFAPVVDIDYNWRNPITNARTYGNDPDRVARMGMAYMKGAREANSSMAVCIKHFPGDGVDERDHHLLSSVNGLSADEWWASYGKVYQTLIDEGAQTLMVGHILQPALEKSICPEITDRDILPASLSKNIVTDIIRRQMGFEGLIVTDSSNMVGYTALMSRKKALAASIMAGIDMILFCKNMDEDFASIRESIETGEITMERLNEAVLRQLMLKAVMGLYEEETEIHNNSVYSSNRSLFDKWAFECADKAITLVKDNQELLPISPLKTKKVRLTVLGEYGATGSFGDSGNVTDLLKQELEEKGFDVAVYDYATFEDREIVDNGLADMKAKFDLSIVVANIPTGSNYTSRRIDWIPFLAANCPWYVKDIPTMFISFCNPHHMVDVPFISTFINAYSANRYCVKACVEKIVGESEFKGISPTDVWCGEIWGAKTY